MSKRGRDGGEEVEIARLAVGPSQSYCGAFPKFNQPKEVACFSRSADRAVTFDRQALRPYRPPVLPAPLDVGFETYVPKSAKEEEPAPLKDVLDALAHRKVDPHAHHFVTCCGVAKVCHCLQRPMGHPPLCEPTCLLRVILLDRDKSPCRWDAEERLRWRSGACPRSVMPPPSDQRHRPLDWAGSATI